jgi:hypothetical protein
MSMERESLEKEVKMLQEKRVSHQEHSTDYLVTRWTEITVGGENGKLVWTLVEARAPAS